MCPIPAPALIARRPAHHHRYAILFSFLLINTIARVAITIVTADVRHSLARTTTVPTAVYHTWFIGNERRRSNYDPTKFQKYGTFCHGLRTRSSAPFRESELFEYIGGLDPHGILVKALLCTTSCVRIKCYSWIRTCSSWCSSPFAAKVACSRLPVALFPGLMRSPPLSVAIFSNVSFRRPKAEIAQRESYIMELSGDCDQDEQGQVRRLRHVLLYEVGESFMVVYGVGIPDSWYGFCVRFGRTCRTASKLWASQARIRQAVH